MAKSVKVDNVKLEKSASFQGSSTYNMSAYSHIQGIKYTCITFGEQIDGLGIST